MRVKSMLTTLLFALEIKFVLKIEVILGEKTTRLRLASSRVSPLHFFRALAASCVLYNRTEHSQGFSIC